MIIFGGSCLVYLKYWTLTLKPLMVYPKILYYPMFTIKSVLEVDRFGDEDSGWSALESCSEA